MRAVFAVAFVGAALAARPAAGQQAAGVFVEARAGVAVTTAEIADYVTTGTAFGGTVGMRFGGWVAMAEVDYGMHEAEVAEGVDITTQHYIAKVGYSVTGPRDRGWEAIINLGGGVVTFDVEDGASHTYPAINAGAKLSYHFDSRFAVVLSPQGNITFSDGEAIGTTNAWVWPLTAGVRLGF